MSNLDIILTTLCGAAVVLYILIVILFIRVQQLRKQLQLLMPTKYGLELMKAPDAHHARMLLNITRLSTILIAILIAAPRAMAQDHPLTPPAGLPHALVHPDSSHGELYDQNCCNGVDCEPIPAAAVKLGSDGWHVEYVSPRNLVGWVRDVVPYGEERQSRGCLQADGLPYCYHACAKTAMKPIRPCSGIGGCEQFDFSKPSTVHCLYVDQGAASLGYRFVTKE